MKKFLAILAAVVVLVIAAVVAAPFLIPLETYKDQIRSQVRAATGRDITLAGDIDLSLLPSTELTVKQVAFANASWAKEPQMAELESLRVKVNPMALLSGELEVQSFVLDKPVIHLAVNADGQPNWSFGTGAAAPAETPGEGAPAGEGGGFGLSDIRLQDVRLVDGRVTYSDMKTGQTYELGDVDLQLVLETLDKPFAADGAVTWNGERVNVELDTGAPRQLMAGQPTEVALKVNAQPITLDYDGQVTNGEPRKLSGQVSLDIPSVKGLAAWAGQPIEAAEGTLEGFSLKGEVSAEGQRYAFTADSLQLDKIQGDGALGIDLSGAKPSLKGKLALQTLDVTPYLPAPTEDAGAAGGQGGDTDGEAGPPADWSDEPIDVSALNAANVDFDLSAEAIKAREIKVGKSALAISMKDGRLQADLKELTLYGGQGTGQIVVDGRGEVPTLAKQLALEGVQAKPLLTDAAGFERLEGTGALLLDVQAQGRSQKAMVQSLDGNGAINFKDGAIVGMNLAAMVRNVTGAFSEAGSEAKKTDFAELSGTFTIQDGVLRNDDLSMLNPLLRVTGKGTANIPQRTVDYRLTPKAVATLKGQESEFQKKGLAVPVIIEGPWHDIAYRPDLESVVRDVLKNPQQLEDTAKKAVEDIKKSAEELKQGGDVKKVIDQLTGGAGSGGGSGSGEAAPQDGAPDETQQKSGGDPAKQLEDAGKALKSLFE